MEDLSAFDYELPPERIAQRPLEDRAASKLLWVHRDTGSFEHRTFRELPEILSAGDLLVLNDTRVSAVRLFGLKESGARVELLLLRELSANEYVALAKPGRRLKPGARLQIEGGMTCQIARELSAGQKIVRFEGEHVRDRIRSVGQTPLPPYIKEPLWDASRYQTVVAVHEGSSAAPTAGLHFTEELLGALERKGVEIAKVTLHIGLDTFRPIQSPSLKGHRMHGELCSLPPETAEAVARCTGRIIAVGTTSVRTLESFGCGPRRVESGSKLSELFIHTDYRFQVVDGMITNFHLPRTTMLVLVASMLGSDVLMNAYREALRLDYRFLSFGDAMLVL
jgi:S-adenosylmethionine:tRNA ribosyltransferase-isomerase